jgi:hypothetical protein
MASLIAVLCFACLASNALAQSITDSSRPAVSFEQVAAQQGTYQEHHVIFDYIAISAAMGTIGGFVVGECHGEEFKGNMVAGHAFVGALLGLFAGAGDEPSWHPPRSVATLDDLKRCIQRDENVEIRTQDGNVVLGKFKRIRKGEIFVRNAEGLRAIPDSEVTLVATRRDPSLDGALWGAAFGALCAQIWYATTSKSPGVSVSQSDMVWTGAGIMGATCLVSDLIHNGRSVVLRRTQTASLPSFEVVPTVSPRALGITVSVRF